VRTKKGIAKNDVLSYDKINSLDIFEFFVLVSEVEKENIEAQKKSENGRNKT
jgi:hypothetical protein